MDKNNIEGLIDLILMNDSDKPQSTPFELSYLASLMRDGSLFINYDYQRNYLYEGNYEKASSFVESIFLGVTIPEIQVFEDKNTRKREIVDGQQRVLSLLGFYDNKYPLKLKEDSLFYNMNGLYYKDLDERIQRVFKNYKIYARIALRDDPEYKFLLFSRLNTGAKPLNAQEIRNCIYRGPMLQMVKEVANHDSVISVMGDTIQNSRFEREEFILYVLSIKNFLNTGSTASSKSKRINRYMDVCASLPEEELLNLKSDFLKVSRFIKEYIDPTFIGNKLRLEGLYVSLDVNKLPALAELSDSLNRELRDTVMSSKYVEVSDKRTASPATLLSRIKLYIDCIDKVIAESPFSGSTQRDHKRCFDASDKEKLIEIALKTDHFLKCGICNQTIYNADDAEVDHIKSWSKGGRTTIDNGQLVHSTCNKKKGNRCDIT